MRRLPAPVAAGAAAAGSGALPASCRCAETALTKVDRMARFDSRDADRFLRPERYRSQNPELVLDALRLALGMTLVDVGSGPGFYTLPAARRVGPTGRVYALDVDPKMLDRLRERAVADGVANIECLISPGDRLPMADAAVDAALVASVLHEIPEWVQLLGEIARVLRPEGALVVVEWRKEQTEMGPPLAERLTYQEIERGLRTAGYGAIEPFEVGPYHYGIRARRGPC